MPREFLLLQGTGCFHKGCAFCHYWDDVSKNPFAINKQELDKVTGKTGVLDIINSGSVHEIDEQTMDYIEKVASEKGIHTIWFETHYHYVDRLDEIRHRFPRQTIKFRTGVESFRDEYRRKMNKDFPDITPEKIREDFDGVCLLVCTNGQTKESIEDDIKIAADLFEYFSVNVFNPNSTSVRLDEELYHWFKETLYPKIKGLPNIEVLIANTDLGVG
ncbi:MAG: radical SAM protein [Clostridiales Family XIII bacterium]|nr:radical SAM protein [Clostridiales Family XIII bacterium]